LSGVLTFISGLEPWILGYSAFLLAVFLFALFGIIAGVRRVARRAEAIRSALEPLSRSESAKTNGLSLNEYDRIVAAVSGLPEVDRRWWPTIERAVEVYVSPNVAPGAETSARFVIVPPDELVHSDHLAHDYRGTRFRAMPGILTALGLLGTFMALLIGLAGLTPDAKGVYELSSLIGNLSGKFVTSILALLLSVVLLALEIWAQGKLERSKLAVVEAVENMLPYLSPSRVFLDIQRESLQQTKAMKNISSDIVDKFGNLFRDDLSERFAAMISGSMATQFQVELRPTLDQLVTVLGNVETTISKLESNKADAVVHQINGLVTSFEASLGKALKEMAVGFKESLSGSTSSELGQLAKAVQGSADTIAGMNTGFESLRSILTGLMEKTKTSTEAQMQSSIEQTERLNALVEGLMIRLSETAAQSQQNVTDTLTTVVVGMSDRLSSLSTELMEAVSATSERSARAAKETVERAGEQTNQTNQKLADLLDTLGVKTADFERGGQVLLDAQGALKATLDQNRVALLALGQAASEVKAYSGGLAGLQREVTDAQRLQRELSASATESVRKLTEASERHGEFIAQYRQIFLEYRGVFEGLDTQLASVLETVVEKMQAYNRAVEDNFKSIVQSASDVMPRMAGVLKQSTEDLREHLDELSDVLTKGIADLNGSRQTGGNRESGQ